MHKLVWDTSALLNIKEPNAEGYSPGYSLYKDFSDGSIPGPYLNIFPALGYFELQASISRKHREGGRMLREFYILGEHSIVYSIDQSLIERSNALVAQPGFDKLRGADLIFACIASLEQAWLVTMDGHFENVASIIKVIDLRESLDSAKYRRLFQ